MSTGAAPKQLQANRNMPHPTQPYVHRSSSEAKGNMPHPPKPMSTGAAPKQLQANGNLPHPTYVHRISSEATSSQR